MEKVLAVQHSHTLPSESEDVKMIGVYRILDAAKVAIGRLGTQPGFSEYPDLIDPNVTGEEGGFYLDEYDLDKDHWADGVTVAGDRDSGSL